MLLCGVTKMKERGNSQGKASEGAETAAVTGGGYQPLLRKETKIRLPPEPFLAWFR